MFKRSALLRAKGGGAVCQGPSVEHGMHDAYVIASILRFFDTR